MDRRDFIKKTLNAGIMVAVPGALVAMAAPTPTPGKDPSVFVMRFPDNWWIHKAEWDLMQDWKETEERAFNDMLLYGETTIKIG